MTSNPGSTRMTSQVSHRSSRITRHVYASTDPPTSHERLEIKYFTAHLCITIRRPTEPPQTGQHELISLLDQVDLERGAARC
jgi:hypothetical protein